MTGLYEVLGVEKSADAATIRKAYRKAAKKAYPDTGGSVDAFALVTTAVDVLTDEKRRKTYDETGRVEDAPIDNAFGFAMQQAMASIDFVLARINARGFFLDDIDVLSDAERNIREKIGQIEKAIAQTEKTQAQLRKTATKFRARKGKTDRIGPMLIAKAAQFEPNLATARREKAGLEMAIEILKDHEFGSGAGKTAHGSANPFQEELARVTRDFAQSNGFMR